MPEDYHVAEEGFGALFDNVNEVPKSQESMEEFEKEIRLCGERHGFKLKSWGSETGMRRFHQIMLVHCLEGEAIEWIKNH